MAQGLWTVNNYPSTATAATVGQAAPGNSTGSSTAANLVNRARGLTVTATGAAAAATGIIEFVVRDGATATGTIIWNASLAAAAGASDTLSVSGLDIRSSIGNALTIESTGAGAAGTQLSVSMQGDHVPLGYPAFQN